MQYNALFVDYVDYRTERCFFGMLSLLINLSHLRANLITSLPTMNISCLNRYAINATSESILEFGRVASFPTYSIDSVYVLV